MADMNVWIDAWRRELEAVEAAKNSLDICDSCHTELKFGDDYECYPAMRDERDALADALDDLHRYSVNDADGYAGSPCEAKVRAALEAVGRKVL